MWELLTCVRDIHMWELLTCVRDIYMWEVLMCGRNIHVWELLTCGTSHQSEILHSLIFLPLQWLSFKQKYKGTIGLISDFKWLLFRIGCRLQQHSLQTWGRLCQITPYSTMLFQFVLSQFSFDVPCVPSVYCLLLISTILILLNKNSAC